MNKSPEKSTPYPSPLLEPEEHVLSTLQADGSRHWLQPKLSRGFLWQRRKLVAYLLIAIFTLLPFIKLSGKPLILLDIVNRKFNIFGFTFLPTDTVLLAIFMVGLLLSIFLFTTLFGRVWCGWACPQTVYMEFLIRPIERIFDGTIGRGGVKKNVPLWRHAAKFVVFFVVCVYLANTFLAYFVGVDELKRWVTRSPLEHPIPFLVMSAVTIAMMIDFCYFREQMCLIACPYGRFQSVLLDQNSLIVSYHEQRGEPRGKMMKRAVLPATGDCIDCGNCVTTCPTGIDIRDGLQMECINCTQCIDACDAVMEKIGRSTGLIRYSSQTRDQGQTTGFIRPRTIIYPILLSGIVITFLTVFLSSKSFDAVVLREPGNPYVLTDNGSVRNILRLKITNRSEKRMTFDAKCMASRTAEFDLREPDFVVGPGQSRTFHASVIADRREFSLGRLSVRLNVTNNTGHSRNLPFQLIGPYD